MRGHIVKRGTNRFYVVVDIGVDARGKRKQKWVSGYTTKVDAERGLTEVLGELDRGIYVSPSRTPLGSYLLEEWLPACAARIRPTTVESYRDLLLRLVVPTLGSVALADLTPVRITTLYGDLLTSGRSRGPGGLSPRTVRYVHGVLRKALSDAVAWRYLALNPCDAAIPPSAASATSPEMKTWNASELRRFLELTKDEREYVAWHLAGCCGLRWRDVHLDTEPPTLAVRQQLVESFYQLTFAPPKTARGRRVVVLDELTVAALRSHRRQQAAERLALGPAYVDHDLVVARLDGSPVHPNNIGQHFQRLVQKSGLPRIRFHDLRHTHATLAMSAGIHPKIVSERLGHASTAFTLDVYSHATPSMQHQAAEVIASLLSAVD